MILNIFDTALEIAEVILTERPVFLPILNTVDLDEVSTAGVRIVLFTEPDNTHPELKLGKAKYVYRKLTDKTSAYIRKSFADNPRIVYPIFINGIWNGEIYEKKKKAKARAKEIFEKEDVI